MEERRSLKGYFTVEAALVFPIVLMSIVLMIYIMFFQYDRCLMEQDLGMLAFRGSVTEAEENHERMEELEKWDQMQDEEKYLAWNKEDVRMKIERGILRVEQNGWMSAVGYRWKASRVYENRLIFPVPLIRSYRKLTGGK